MKYPPDRALIRVTLENQSQKLRNERKTLENALTSIERYKSKQINKRLCTFIEENSGKRWREVFRWNRETRKDETKSESYPCIYARLEKKDYGHIEYTLTLYAEYNDRATIWFKDLPDLIEGIKNRIEALGKSIQQIMDLEKNIDIVIDRYEKAKDEMDKIMDIKGMYYIKELL